jgi:hypothetical protein
LSLSPAAPPQVAQMKSGQVSSLDAQRFFMIRYPNTICLLKGIVDFEWHEGLKSLALFFAILFRKTPSSSIRDDKIRQNSPMPHLLQVALSWDALRGVFFPYRIHNTEGTTT